MPGPRFFQLPPPPPQMPNGSATPFVWGQTDTGGVAPHPAISSAIDNATQGLLGFLGLGQSDNRANLYGQLLQAAIPFSAPLGRVFHGTGQALEMFDPARNSIHDLLGLYQHMAEDPAYADYFALHHTPVATVKEPGAYSAYQDARRPNVVPAVPQAKNALDLMNPLPEEDWNALSKAAVQIHPDVADDVEKYRKLQDALQAAGSSVRGMMPALVHDGLARLFSDNPDLLTRAGFDALRYEDFLGPDPAWYSSPTEGAIRSRASWAVPASTPIQTPWGAPLTRSAVGAAPPTASPVGDLLKRYQAEGAAQAPWKAVTQGLFKHLTGEGEFPEAEIKAWAAQHNAGKGPGLWELIHPSSLASWGTFNSPEEAAAAARAHPNIKFQISPKK